MKTRVVHVNDNVPGAVYIGRANGRKRLLQSKWRNPYTVRHVGREAAVQMYGVMIRRRLAEDPYGHWHDGLRELAGKPLACWCRHDGEERTENNACHGDVLVELIRELGLEN